MLSRLRNQRFCWSAYVVCVSFVVSPPSQISLIPSLCIGLNGTMFLLDPVGHVSLSISACFYVVVRHLFVQP